MKTSLVAVLLTLALPAAFAADSRITDVTVYPDRARITRTATVNLVAGENRIEFAGLPVSLMDDSVRATGQAAAPVSILDVTVRRSVLEQVPDEAIARLEADLQKLRDERAALDARQRVVDRQRQLLEQIQIKGVTDVSRDIAINKFDLAQLQTLPAYLAGEWLKLEEQTQQIAVARRDLDRKLRVAEAEFNKRRAAATRAAKTVIVTVAAKEPTRFQTQISYVIGNASWSPSYDARAAAETGKVELTYHATVRQQTGEDWTGVNLTLSTARPAIGARMPELDKWTLRFWDVVPFSGESRREKAAADISALAGAPQSTLNVTAEAVPATPAETTVEPGVTAVSFRVPRPADVPSDGEPHRQTVSVFTLGAIYSYVATPKLSSFAYLRAGVTNTTEAPLLGGPVNVFVGNDFMGTGYIGTVPASAKFDLFLGVDEGLHIKREELKDKRGKSGIFNKRVRQVYGYKLVVENYKSGPQRITLHEPFPVSSHDDIKVTLGEFSVKPSEVDHDKGRLTWELTLAPREKRELVYEFTVEWPADKNVQGL